MGYVLIVLVLVGLGVDVLQNKSKKDPELAATSVEKTAENRP